MEIKEFKVPLYKDEKGNEYISTRHINEGINGKEIGEKDFFDTGNIQGEIKKDNIIDLSSYKSSIDDKDEIITSHTTSPVPFIITDNNIEKINSGKLGDIAPTILDYMGLDIPVEMTGNRLI